MSPHRQRESFIRILIAAQATYTMLTAIWPLIHIDSFIAVTGPKEDIWLVKTVGALLIPVSVCLFSYLFIDSDWRPAMILGSLTAFAFACIDFYYATTDVISNVYLADGVVELILFAGWIFVIVRRIR